MKRFLTLVAAVAASMILAAGAHAQFGFLVGLTSSSVKMASSDAISLYHAGLTYKINLPSGFAIQPAVLYQVKGANVGQLGTATDEDFKVKTGFVEVPLGLQWGPHLAAFRPYVFAEPFIGYRVSSTDRGNETFRDWASQAKNKFEYGFGLGAGLEISDHLQLSVQWFNNLGAMFSKPAEAGTESLGKVKNFEGIKFSLAILF
jgi:hypothetical protein